MAPRLEGAVLSAGGVEVEEEVFENLRGLSLSVEVSNEGEALCENPFYDVSTDPIGGPELVSESEDGERSGASARYSHGRPSP